MQLAGEGGGEVEPKPVHVHVQHPVAQAVHQELERARVGQVQRIAAACEVAVAAPIPVFQAVVGGVVDAAKAQGGAAMIALCSVVVHHVEDDFDARLVEALHHGLELADLLAAGA